MTLSDFSEEPIHHQLWEPQISYGDARFCETLMCTDGTTWRHIPEAYNLNIHCSEDVNAHFSYENFTNPGTEAGV